MRTCVCIMASAMAMTLTPGSATAAPAGTGFTYQGQLKQGGIPVTGEPTAQADFRFALFDAETGGTQVGSTLVFDGQAGNAAPVDVTNGLFTRKLDFGVVAFDGNARWLEVQVRSPHDATDTKPYSTLTPRQSITPTPYALQTRGLFTDANGSVGIGTTNPGAPLHIAASAPAVVLEDTTGLGPQQVGFISLRDASGNEKGYLGFGGSTTSDLTIANSHPAGDVRIVAGGQAIMTVSPGNVGIGTSSPASKLTVARPANTGPIEFRVGANDGTSRDFIVRKNTSSPYETHFIGSGNTTPGVGAAIRFFTADTPADERLTILTGGNVGIGTTNPQQKLDVHGDIEISHTATGDGALKFKRGANPYANAEVRSHGSSSGLNEDLGFYTGGGDAQSGPPELRMIIAAEGNVGIGTTAPTAQLHVRRDSVDNVQLLSLDYVGGDVGGTSEADALMRVTSTSGFRPYLSLDGKFVVTAGGAVGIGTASPGSMLTVAGVVESAGGFKFPDGSVQTTAASGGGGTSPWTPSGSDIYYNAGNVGIGTSIPGSKLVLQSNDNQLLLAETGNSTSAGGLVFNSALGQPAFTLQERNANGALLRNLISIFVSDGSLLMRDQGNPGTTGGIVFNSALGQPGFTFQKRGTNGGFLDNLVSILADGTLRAKVVEITGADVAERFPVKEDIQPGMVVAIDPENPGHLRLSRTAYSPLVAGVASGANGLSAGTILGNLPGDQEAPPIALSGRVWCACDASYGAIKPGDLLTTSDTPGHAMKASDHTASQGAVLGKAMTPLKNGKGFVLVLVTLQ